MHATIKKWGNSYGIRLTKGDLERLGIQPEQTVRIQIVGEAQAGIDVAKLPVLEDLYPMSLAETREAYAALRPGDWA